MKNTHRFLLLFSLVLFMSCTTANNPQQKTSNAKAQKVSLQLDGLSKAYFASGCFWCVEAVFESVKGVKEAVSGYSGGVIKNPTYEQICTGRLKHAEAVEVYYDPTEVSYETLVKVFFGSHDPTTPNRQGPDKGPQYRSMIYYIGETEKNIATSYIEKLTADKTFDAPIVTEVVPFDVFYKAEDYHQDYERKHPDNSYVRAVSVPRLNRFKKKFPELLKEEGGH